jgi:hypothetical protein
MNEHRGLSSALSYLGPVTGDRVTSRLSGCAVLGSSGYENADADVLRSDSHAPAGRLESPQSRSGRCVRSGPHPHRSIRPGFAHTRPHPPAARPRPAKPLTGMGSVTEGVAAHGRDNCSPFPEAQNQFSVHWPTVGLLCCPEQWHHPRWKKAVPVRCRWSQSAPPGTASDAMPRRRY